MKKRLWLLGAALVLVYALWDGYHIDRSAYTAVSGDLPEAFRGFRVTELSDLHSRAFGNDYGRLLRAVRETEPDLIAIDGDLFDERTEDIRALDPLLRGLCNIAPTYYVTGNHEWRTEDLPGTLDHFRSLGVTVLENEYTVLEREGQWIAVAGVHDPNGPRDMKSKETLVAEIRADLGEDVYILMLAHRNGQMAEWTALGVQTVLTGHGHGGLIRLPFVGGLIGVDRELFPTYDAGAFRAGDTTMIVSRGLGNSVPIPRLFNGPDLPIITLERENG